MPDHSRRVSDFFAEKPSETSANVSKEDCGTAAPKQKGTAAEDCGTAGGKSPEKKVTVADETATKQDWGTTGANEWTAGANDWTQNWTAGTNDWTNDWTAVANDSGTAGGNENSPVRPG